MELLAWEPFAVKPPLCGKCGSDRTQTVHVDDLLTMSEFDIFEGRTLRGGVVLTAVRGEVVFRDGQLTGQPGHGRYLRRR